MGIFDFRIKRGGGATTAPEPSPVASPVVDRAMLEQVVQATITDVANKAAVDAAAEVGAQITQAIQQHFPTDAAGNPTSGAGLTRAMLAQPNSLVHRRGYAMNNPHLFQTMHDPRFRPYSTVTVETLRILSRNYSILASCITHLKSEVIKVPVNFVAKDAKDSSPETEAQIEAATAFCEEDGGLGGPGNSRQDYEGKLIDDLLVIGAGAAALEYDTVGTRDDGSPDRIIAIDASTIQPLVNQYGYQPGYDADAYRQWVMGRIVGNFRRDEMLYHGLAIYAQSNSPYYMSAVENLIAVVYAALKSEEWNRTWLSDGNSPDQWMRMPPEMAPDMAAAWLEIFDGMVSGDAKQRHKIKITPGDITGERARKDQDFQEFDGWLRDQTCSVLGVHPTSIGFQGNTYKDSQDDARDSTSEGRVEQLKEWRLAHYNRILKRKGWRNIEAVDKDSIEEDIKARADRHVVEVSNGLRTINETRKEDGLDPVESPNADKLLAPATLTPIDMLGQSPAEVPGDPTNPAAGPDPSAAPAPIAPSPKPKPPPGQSAFGPLVAHPALSRRQEGKVYDFACALMPLSEDDAAEVMDWARANIPAGRLIDDGIETKPHITVRYGLESDDVGAVEAVIDAGGYDAPLLVNVGPLAVFRGDEHDVLVLKVYSGDLCQLHDELAVIPHTDTFSTYVPHVTVAYCKPGLADVFIGSQIPGLKQLSLPVVEMCDRLGRSTAINLGDLGPVETPASGNGQLLVDMGAPEIAGDGMVRVLRQWENKALNRLKQGRPALCDFETDALNEQMKSMVRDRLTRCDSKSAVRQLFSEVTARQSHARLTVPEPGGSEVHRAGDNSYDPSQMRDETGKWTAGGGVIHTAQRTGGSEQARSARARVAEILHNSEQTDQSYIQPVTYVAGRIKRLHEQITATQHQIGTATPEQKRLLTGAISEYRSAVDRYMDQLKDLAGTAHTARRQSIDQAQQVLYQDDKPGEARAPAIAVTDVGEPKWSTKERSTIDRAVTLFRRLSGHAIQPGTEVKFGRVQDGERPHYSPRHRAIMLAPNAPASVIVHELGHLLENSNKDVLAKAYAFLQSRTKGEAVQPLSSITGNQQYNDSEKAKKDDFINPYMGKAYFKGDYCVGTEVISCGLEILARNPGKLATDDPQYFDFLYDVLHSN